MRMCTGDDAHTMADYLASLLGHGDTGDDMVTHDVLTEGAARFGRRVYVWDDYGFTAVDTYATTADALAFMTALADDYYGPDDDDWPDAWADDDTTGGPR